MALQWQVIDIFWDDMVECWEVAVWNGVEVEYWKHEGEDLPRNHLTSIDNLEIDVTERPVFACCGDPSDPRRNSSWKCLHMPSCNATSCLGLLA
jgi:hypothetical protein